MELTFASAIVIMATIFFAAIVVFILANHRESTPLLIVAVGLLVTTIIMFFVCLIQADEQGAESAKRRGCIDISGATLPISYNGEQYYVEGHTTTLCKVPE